MLKEPNPVLLNCPNICPLVIIIDDETRWSRFVIATHAGTLWSLLRWYLFAYTMIVEVISASKLLAVFFFSVDHCSPKIMYGENGLISSWVWQAHKSIVPSIMLVKSVLSLEKNQPHVTWSLGVQRLLAHTRSMDGNIVRFPDVSLVWHAGTWNLKF